MSTLKDVTEDTFAVDVLEAEGVVVVDFWAEWCGPCRYLEPVLEQIAAEHPQNLTVVKVNADENLSTAARYHAMSLPTLKVFRDGEPVKTIVGAKSKAAMEAELAPFLS